MSSEIHCGQLYRYMERKTATLLIFILSRTSLVIQSMNVLPLMYLNVNFYCLHNTTESTLSYKISQVLHTPGGQATKLPLSRYFPTSFTEGASPEKRTGRARFPA